MDAVLEFPINPLEVEREVKTLASTGRSASVSLVLQRTGDRLLNHDPSLWQFDDQDPWMDRMQALVSAGKKPADPREISRWATRVLRALDQAFGVETGPLTGEALRRVFAEGTETLEDIADEFCVSAAKLRRLFRIANKALASCDFPWRADRATEKVVSQVAAATLERQQASEFEEDYLPLLRAAGRLYENPAPHTPSAEYLCRDLGRRLGISARQIARLGVENLRRVAAQILDALDADRAVDLARLKILSFSMKEEEEEVAGVDTDRLKSLRRATRADEAQADGGADELGLARVVAEIAVVEKVMAEHAEATRPGDADPAAVEALLKAGDLNSALAAAPGLPGGHPRTVPLLSRIATALLGADRAAEGLPLITRARDLQPRRLPLHLSAARLALAAGEPEAAEAALDCLEAMAPGFGDSERLRAQLAEAA